MYTGTVHSAQDLILDSNSRVCLRASYIKSALD